MMEDIREELNEDPAPEAMVPDDDAAAPDHTDEAGDVARLATIIESVLFAAATPLSLRKLVDALEGPTIKEVQEALTHLHEQYAPGQRGIQLLEVAGGYQLRTARENASWVRAVFREKPMRLGRATLETLAIVAYKQPVTRADIEAIRGVDADAAVSTLLARRLIKIAGRKEGVGRPLLYATTPEFLEIFGLKDLKELPALHELAPAQEDHGPTDPTETLAEAGDPAADAPTNGNVTPHEDTAPAAAPVGAAPDGDAGADCPPTVDVGPAAVAEDPESGGDRLAAGGGGVDPVGPGPGERPDGEGTGNKGGPTGGPDHR
jgi:segregation and condensation protein B